jgi:hypothetical protein
MKMKPLQIWLPRFGESIKFPETSRDAMRAFESWHGELVVWMLREASKPVRWRLNGIGQLAIPSEEIFDRIDIAHMSEDGLIYSPTTKDMMPPTVEGLLDAWLNVEKSGGVSLVDPLKSITVVAPFVDSEGKIATRKRTITFDPGAYIPLDSVNRETDEVRLKWPPEGSPSPVSPEAESAKRFPLKELEADPSIAVTEQGDRALRAFLRWPGVLASMMPLLSGPDDILAQSQMVTCARQSASDLPGALRTAIVAAQPYMFDGHSTVEHTLFRPTRERKGLSHVLLKAEEWGLTIPPQMSRQWDDNVLNRVLEQDDWQQWLAKLVPIRRAWGPVGLFWSLLIDRLGTQRSFKACELCDRIIAGKDGKRFCGKNDDVECFNRRRAIDQRRSRYDRAKSARRVG